MRNGEKTNPSLGQQMFQLVNHRIALLGAENPEPNLDLHVEILDPLQCFLHQGPAGIPGGFIEVDRENNVFHIVVGLRPLTDSGQPNLQGYRFKVQSES